MHHHFVYFVGSSGITLITALLNTKKEEGRSDEASHNAIGALLKKVRCSLEDWSSRNGGVVVSWNRQNAGPFQRQQGRAPLDQCFWSCARKCRSQELTPNSVTQLVSDLTARTLANNTHAVWAVQISLSTVYTCVSVGSICLWTFQHSWQWMWLGVLVLLNIEADSPLEEDSAFCIECRKKRKKIANWRGSHSVDSCEEDAKWRKIPTLPTLGKKIAFCPWISGWHKRCFWYKPVGEFVLRCAEKYTLGMHAIRPTTDWGTHNDFKHIMICFHIKPYQQNSNAALLTWHDVVSLCAFGGVLFEMVHRVTQSVDMFNLYNMLHIYFPFSWATWCQSCHCYFGDIIIYPSLGRGFDSYIPPPHTHWECCFAVLCQRMVEFFQGSQEFMFPSR